MIVFRYAMNKWVYLAARMLWLSKCLCWLSFFSLVWNTRHTFYCEWVSEILCWSVCMVKENLFYDNFSVTRYELCWTLIQIKKKDAHLNEWLMAHFIALIFDFSWICVIFSLLYTSRSNGTRDVLNNQYFMYYAQFSWFLFVIFCANYSAMYNLHSHHIFVISRIIGSHGVLYWRLFIVM